MAITETIGASFQDLSRQINDVVAPEVKRPLDFSALRSARNVLQPKAPSAPMISSYSHYVTPRFITTAGLDNLEQ